MSVAAASPQRQLRAFLTQSAHSTGAASSRRPTTASGTIGGFDSGIFDSAEITRPDSATNSTMIRLAATVDEARSRMSSLKRIQLMEAEQMALMSKSSDELRNYSRDRFMDRMKVTDVTPPPACKSETRSHRPASSKCVISPYVTVPKPVDVGDPYCCEAAATPDELRNSRSRTRAQLMSQLRLHQPLQPVKFRHDRTAQELAQEGCLPSRNLCEAFPWQQDYKYTPYPTPKFLAWTRDEAERRLERQRLAEEFDRVETPPPATTPPTPPTSPPVLLLPPPLQAPLPVPPPEPATQQQQLSAPANPEQQRPKSGARAKTVRRGHQKHQQQQQLTPEQQALLLEQQLAEKAAARRRNFSVSTIGEEEMAPTRLEQQRLADVCQRLRDRQLAREAAAAAAAAEAAAAEAALKAAAEAANAPPEPPKPPTPTLPAEKASKKKRSGSAGSSSRKKTQAAGQTKQSKKAPSRSPRSASSASDQKVAKKKQGSSGAPSRSSSVSSDSAKPAEEGKKKPAGQQQSKQKKAGKASPRAKSPKGGKKPPAGKKGKAAQQPQQQQTPPPTLPLETEPIEPGAPDPIELLADEIESAQVFHRTKAPDELPDFPCPSSEGKSRQQLTKYWWQRQAISAGGVSVIT